MPKSPPEAAAELAELAAVDLKAAVALAAMSEDLRPVVLFHCQQGAEKWLKAFLTARGIQPPLIHALGLLLDVAVASAPSLEALRDDAEFLSPFGVAPRYILRPVADSTLVPRAIASARRMRDAILMLLR